MVHQVKNPPALQETQEMQVGSPGREDPLEEDMATHSRILAEKSQGQRNLVGYRPWGHKESDTTEGMSRDAHISKSELYEIICKNNNNKVLSFKLLYEIIINYCHRHNAE